MQYFGDFNFLLTGCLKADENKIVKLIQTFAQGGQVPGVHPECKGRNQEKENDK